MESITIYDGKKEINVFDWDSADCSLEKILLAKDDSNNNIYLFVANREWPEKLKDMLPQTEPSPERIKIFQLVKNIKHEFERPQSYFEKISEYKTKEYACTGEEVYALVKKTAIPMIKKVK